MRGILTQEALSRLSSEYHADHRSFVPAGPDRMLETYGFFLETLEPDEIEREAIRCFDEVPKVEHIALVESVQTGMVAPAFEQSIWGFAQVHFGCNKHIKAMVYQPPPDAPEPFRHNLRGNHDPSEHPFDHGRSTCPAIHGHLRPPPCKDTKYRRVGSGWNTL